MIRTQLNLLSAHSQYDDYEVLAYSKQIGKLRRMCPIGDEEYWFLLEPSNGKIHRGKSGAKRAIYYLLKIVFPDELDSTSTY